MILVMYRDDQHKSQRDAYNAGACRAVHFDSHIYKGRRSGQVADVCDAIETAIGMMQGDAVINCVLLEDDDKFIDAFQLSGEKYAVQ